MFKCLIDYALLQGDAKSSQRIAAIAPVIQGISTLRPFDVKSGVGVALNLIVVRFAHTAELAHALRDNLGGRDLVNLIVPGLIKGMVQDARNTASLCQLWQRMLPLSIPPLKLDPG